MVKIILIFIKYISKFLQNMSSKILDETTFFLISRHLTFDEIYMLGCLCSILRTRVRVIGNTWKKIMMYMCPSQLWNKLEIDDSEYIEIAMNCKTPWHNVRKCILNDLKRQYILRRLKLEMRNPEALRLCLIIETPTLPSPHDKTSLTGIVDIDDEYLEQEINRSREENQLKKSRAADEEEEVDEWRLKYAPKTEPKPSIIQPESTYESHLKKEAFKRKEFDKNKNYKIVFKRTDGRVFYYWCDSRHYSETKFYVVDRLQKGGLDVTNAPTFEHCIDVKKTKTVPTQDNYAEIFKLTSQAKTDKTHTHAEESMPLLSSGFRRTVEPNVHTCIQWSVKVDFVSWFENISKNIIGYVEPTFAESNNE
jgi:hypothetical protein